MRDDALADKLEGGSGQDWFFTGALDAQDDKSGEIVDSIAS